MSAPTTKMTTDKTTAHDENEGAPYDTNKMVMFAMVATEIQPA